MDDCVRKLSDALVETARTLGPIVAGQRTRGRGGPTFGRDFQSGFCWSFAEGVGLWVGSGSKADVWIEDWEGDSYPVHVAWRAPSGLFLDSFGAADQGSSIRSTLTAWLEDAVDDVQSWVGDANGFEMRRAGIFPPRKTLVELVSTTMSEIAGSSASYPCLATARVGM